jgi:hypothetical protein
MHSHRIVLHFAPLMEKLVKVDVEIQKLRDRIAAGKASLDELKQLDALIEQRLSLMEDIAKEKTLRVKGTTSAPAPENSPKAVLNRLQVD